MILRNNKGQMAILIALFFQILFVLFAMAINVGLVVHDKINLQSSVDLAAYYGAAKQAEILNQIAHINFQMRQAYKLFNWRYHGLSSMGRTTHPWYQFQGPGVPNAFQPSVCVAHPVWAEFATIATTSSYCRDDASIENIGGIDQSLIPGLGILGDLLNDLVGVFGETGQTLTDECRTAGFVNWWFATQLLAAFRIDGVEKKEMIRRLSGSLSEGEGDFTDLSGGSVLEGVENTLRNNLTAGNRNGSPQIEFFNSLGSGSCAQSWLQPINIYALIRYTSISGEDRGNCDRVALNNNNDQSLPQFPLGLDPASFDQLVQHWFGNVEDDLKSSIGFEKNPWCMAYVGVKAQTQSRKIFSPLGNPVQLTASSFAKPFGGRVGPFYGTTWGPGQNQSNNQVKTDPHLPDRDTDGATPPTTDEEVERNIINYSQYVGDPTGMANPQRLAPLLPSLQQTIAAPGNINSSLQWAQYYHMGSRQQFQVHGDALARQYETQDVTGNDPIPPQQLAFERAMVAPDAFDITFYSIEPKYHDLYFSGTTIPNHIIPEDQRIFDYGSSKDEADGKPVTFNVQGQIVGSFQGGGNLVFYQPNDQEIPTYVVKEWDHLLTGWHQNGAVDFSLDEEKFQACTGETQGALRLKIFKGNFLSKACSEFFKNSLQLKL